MGAAGNMALTPVAAGAGRLLHAVLLALTWLTVEAQRPIPFKKEADGTELMITPNIMSAILFGIVWLMLFSAGFCCLFQVQTPSAYEEKCLILNKQYRADVAFSKKGKPMICKRSFFD